MTNVELFIALQDKANQEIDTLGQTTHETFKELDDLSEILTSAEIDDILAIRVKRSADKLN